MNKPALKSAVLFALFCLVTGCLHLDRDLIDTPQDARAMIKLPSPDSDIWIAEQGLPLKMAWLTEGQSDYQHGKMFVLPYTLSQLPYNNTEENEDWIGHINQNYAPTPTWQYIPDKRMGHYKCMSLSAATVLNWHMIDAGQQLNPYKSWLSGKTEFGIDHRILDAIYYQRAGDASTEDQYPLLSIQLDPVEQTPISYSMNGFANILSSVTSSPAQAISVNDHGLAGVTHSLDTSVLPALETIRLFGYEASYKVRANDDRHVDVLKQALHEYGPIFAGIRVRFASSGGVITDNAIGRLSIPNMSGHGVVIVGYVEQNQDTFFIYRETFGKFDTTSSQGGPAYRAYPAHAFNEAFAFNRKGNG